MPQPCVLTGADEIAAAQAQRRLGKYGSKVRKEITKKAEKLGLLGCKVMMSYETPSENDIHEANSMVMQGLASHGPASAAQQELSRVMKGAQSFLSHLSQPGATAGSLTSAAVTATTRHTQLQQPGQPAAQHSELAGSSAAGAQAASQAAASQGQAASAGGSDSQTRHAEPQQACPIADSAAAPSTFRSQNLAPAVVPDFSTMQVHVHDGTVGRVHKPELLQYLAAQGHGSYYRDKSTKQALMEFIMRITPPGAKCHLDLLVKHNTCMLKLVSIMQLQAMVLDPARKVWTMKQI